MPYSKVTLLNLSSKSFSLFFLDCFLFLEEFESLELDFDLLFFEEFESLELYLDLLFFEESELEDLNSIFILSGLNLS